MHTPYPTTGRMHAGSVLHFLSAIRQPLPFQATPFISEYDHNLYILLNAKKLKEQIAKTRTVYLHVEPAQQSCTLRGVKYM